MTAPATLDIELITFQNEPVTTCADAAGEPGLFTEIKAGAAEGPDMLTYQPDISTPHGGQSSLCVLVLCVWRLAVQWPLRALRLSGSIGESIQPLVHMLF
jgi:hypothetical protein